jgi:serine/threonine protein kinase
VPILVVEKGSEKGATFTIEPGKAYVCGRDTASALALTDIMVSRRHFAIQESDRGFLIRDLKSRSGTFLNDERLQEPTLLRIGDKIQAGMTLLSFLSDGKEETPQGLVGKAVGGYKILDRIGRGGMGTVYKAIQLSLNREVALKVLSARLLKDEAFVDRFKYEARAAGQMNHPNIVQVYDVGTDAGLHFFSMEFMEGGSAQDVIGKDGRIPWEQALDMMIDAAKGLVFAERNDIVHRDIKPDNLMLTDDGSVKIGDLGLATRKAEGGDPNARGPIFGTPHFISPEQAQGMEVGHAADRYSLGATFYRILAGRNPFQGEQVQDIIRQQIQDDPTPLRELAPEVPAAVAGVIHRLMKKNPDERYASAAELVEELEAIRMTHHPAMRSGRGGKIGFLVGAVVIVLAVVAFLVLGGNRNGNGNGNGSGEPPPPIDRPTEVSSAPSVDPEAEEKTRRVEAENALLRIKSAAPGELTEENHAAATWDEYLMALREKVVDAYPDTPAAEQATTLLEDLRTRREALAEAVREREREAIARRTSIRKKLDALAGQVREKVGAREFSEALVLWTEAGDLDLIRSLEETKKAYEALQTEILDAAESHRKSVETEVAGLVGAEKWLVALDKVEAFLRGWNVRKRSEDVFSEGRGWALRTRDDLRSRIRDRLNENLDHDARSFVPAYRRVRRLAAEGDGANQVGAFDFAGAAGELRGLLEGEGALRTWPYRERLERKILDLERMERFLVRFVEAVNDGRATSMKIKLEGRGALGGEGTIETMDRTGFKGNFKTGVARLTIPKEFADFTPTELFEVVLLRGKRTPLTPTDRLDLVLLLAETGAHGAIDEVLEGLGPIDELPEAVAADARDVLARLEAERAAAREWAEIQETFRRSHDASQLRQRIAQWQARFARTDFLLLQGASPPPDTGLLTRDEITRFVQTLGRRE